VRLTRIALLACLTTLVLPATSEASSPIRWTTVNATGGGINLNCYHDPRGGTYICMEVVTVKLTVRNYAKVRHDVRCTMSGWWTVTLADGSTVELPHASGVEFIGVPRYRHGHPGVAVDTPNVILDKPGQFQTGVSAVQHHEPTTCSIVS
jgi:hypothetical protein